MQPNQEQQKSISDFNSKYKEFLDNTQITWEPSDRWFKAAENALLCTTAFKIGVLAHEMFDLFKKLSVKKTDLSLWEFAQANNTLQECSYHDLKRVFPSAYDYFEIQVEAEAMSRLWNEQSKERYAELEREIIQAQKTVPMRPVKE